MTEKLTKYKCPDCDCEDFEIVITNKTYITLDVRVDEDGYFNVMSDGGNVESEEDDGDIKCSMCGSCIDGDKIDDVNLYDEFK